MIRSVDRRSALPRKTALLVSTLGLLCCCLWTGTASQGAEPKLLAKCAVDRLRKPRGVYPPFEFLAISDDGKQLASSGLPGGLCLWNLATAKPESLLQRPGNSKGFPATYAAISFLPDPNRLAMLKLVVSLKAGTRSSPGQVFSNTLQLQIWDLATGKPIHELDVPMPPGKPKGFVGPWENPRLLVSLNRARIAADVDTIHFSTNAEIREWNHKLPDGFPKSSSFFDGNAVTTVTVWDSQTMRPTTSLQTAWGFAPCALSPDGTRLAVWDGTANLIAIYDTTTGGTTPPSAESTVRTPTYGRIFAMSFLPDGTTLATVHNTLLKKEKRPGSSQFEFRETDDLQIDRWNIAAGKLRGEPSKLPGKPSSNGPSSNGTQAGETSDPTARHRNGNPVLPMLSANGSALAVAADKHHVAIFDVESGSERATLTLPDGLTVENFALSRNGRFAAVSSAAGWILAWDLPAAFTVNFHTAGTQQTTPGFFYLHADLRMSTMRRGATIAKARAAAQCTVLHDHRCVFLIGEPPVNE